jgi:hypothetical protein
MRPKVNVIWRPSRRTTPNYRLVGWCTMIVSVSSLIFDGTTQAAIVWVADDQDHLVHPAIAMESIRCRAQSPPSSRSCALPRWSMPVNPGRCRSTFPDDPRHTIRLTLCQGALRLGRARPDPVHLAAAAPNAAYRNAHGSSNSAVRRTGRHQHANSPAATPPRQQRSERPGGKHGDDNHDRDQVLDHPASGESGVMG